MEEADVDDLFEVRRHPYTRGLLASLPRPGTSRPNRLTAIPGLPPDPMHLPPGCPYAPRCPHAIQRCDDERPEPREPVEGHAVACHFDPEELYE